MKMENLLIALIVNLAMTKKTIPRRRRRLQSKRRKKVSIKSVFLPSTFSEKPAKILSKKEQKAIEDAEFEAYMSGVAVEKKDDKTEKKAEVVVGDANSKNKKKKEKAKAKKEADDKAKKEADAKAKKEKDEKKEVVTELTAEEKKAAIKAAMEKRGNVATKTTKDDSIAK